MFFHSEFSCSLGFSGLYGGGSFPAVVSFYIPTAFVWLRKSADLAGSIEDKTEWWEIYLKEKARFLMKQVEKSYVAFFLSSVRIFLEDRNLC